MESLPIIFMYLIGIMWVIVGGLLLFATDLVMKKFLTKFITKVDPKKWAPVAIILGIFLLLSASYNRHTLFVILLGLLGVLKGILFVIAPERMEKMKDWWLKAGNKVHKIWGVLLIALGSIVLTGL